MGKGRGFAVINKTRQKCPKCGRKTYIYVRERKQRFCTECEYGTRYYDESCEKEV